MSVTDLVLRIQDDLEELLARAYPTYTQEWEQKFAAEDWPRFPTTYEDMLRSRINKSVAEELCSGSWERITSQDAIVRRKASEEYQRLLQQFLEGEPRHAANALAVSAKRAAGHLKNLSVERRALMKEMAAKHDLWPVNLGLRVKVVKGKTVREVTGLAFARNYLIELELNSQCDFPTAQGGGSHSPFRLAAEELYTKMLMLKDAPQRRAWWWGRKVTWFRKVSPWAKRLFALTAPMTKSNSLDWWKVAKVYLYERWGKAQKEFKPLIEHLGFKYPIELSDKTPYESNIKSRVIDNGLKDAFMALARSDL